MTTIETLQQQIADFPVQRMWHGGCVFDGPDYERLQHEIRSCPKCVQPQLRQELA